MEACVVFGGSRGIGAAVAKRLVLGGFNVAVVSRDKGSVASRTESLKNEVGAGQVLGLSCDITDTDKMTETITEVNERLGPVRVLVNAAGITQNQLLLKTSADDIRRYLDVNLVGAMVASRAVLRGMVQRRQGCIINIGSIVGSKGNAGQCAYSASKAGLEGFTKSLAKEVAGRGITVNCVNPGFIRTDMTSGLPHIDQLQRQIPLGRLGEPEEVADLVWFLTHATYITGQTMFVDGGLQINS